MFPHLNARTLAQKIVKKFPDRGGNSPGSLTQYTWIARGHSFNKSTRLDNHIKYLESQSEKQKNKSEVMKANKKFSAGVRHVKWSLKRKIERMEMCGKTKYIGLLTIPAGEKYHGESERNNSCWWRNLFLLQGILSEVSQQRLREQKLCPTTEVTPVAYRLCCHAGTDHQCVYRKFQVVLFKKPFPWDC